MSELYIPVFMPRENKIVTLSNHELLRTTLPNNGSAEMTARTFAASHLGLNAIKAVGGVHFEDMAGYAVHTAVDQPYTLRTNHRFIVGVYDIDEYLEAEETSKASAAMVHQAVENLPYQRRGK